MLTVQKAVHYCEFCRKHGLSRHAMEAHERRCTLNPVRVCRWAIDGHSNGAAVIDIAPLAEWLRARATPHPLSADPESDEHTYLTQEDIDLLHDEVSGCPACMLAALRQSGVDEWHHAYQGGSIFDYAAQVEAIRKQEREEADGDRW